MKLQSLFLSLSGIIISISSYSAVDPVSWSLSPTTGFPATQEGHQSVVQYTLTNQLPFPAVLTTDYLITGGNFTIHDECRDRSILPHNSCDVTVGFNPAEPGNSTFELIYGYHNNRIPTPKLTATGTAQPSGAVLHGVIRGLPPTFYKGNTVDFTAIFTNKGKDDLTGCTVAPNITSMGVPAVINSNQGVPPCTGQILVGESCQWDGTVTSNTPGALTVIAHMTCTGPSNVSSEPQASTIVQNESGCVAHVSVDLPLPSTTHQYSDNIVKFKVENECPTPVTLTPFSVQASGVSAIITVSDTLSTCGTTLAADTDCYVYASVIPQGPGTMTVTGSTQTGDAHSVSASTSASVIVPGYTHTINFINQCKFPVWYGVENSSGNPNVQDPTPNPTPDSYLLGGQVEGARPVVKSITIPGTYLGEFFPRTGCSVSGGNFVCKTADCNSPAATGQCNGDATSPFTRIEEVFFPSIIGAGYQGTYDISLINGISIPVEMKGLGPANSNPVFDDTPFYCTGAGAPIQPPQPMGSQTLGECGWDFSVPSAQNMEPKLFNFVRFTAANYNCAAACGSGEVCGLAYTNNDVTMPITMSCGKLLGYWTINQSCSANSNYDAMLPGGDNPKTVFNCAMPYPGGRYPLGANYYDIYSCNTPAGPNPVQLGSCYPSTSGNLCCGAQNWDQTPYITAQDIDANFINPDWTTGSPLVPSPYFSILWIKEACPTAYVYPYDDHSSSFRCYTSDGKQNNIVKMDFDVVFCPGGLKGELSDNP